MNCDQLVSAERGDVDETVNLFAHSVAHGVVDWLQLPDP